MVNQKTDSGERRRTMSIVLATAAVLFVPTLFLRGLWAPDEPRYAAVAWDMAHRGEFLVPHLNGEIYDQKPPLFFYLAAAADLIAPQRGGRIVEAVAVALLALLLPAFFAPNERQAALLAPCIFMTTVLGLELGKFGVIDAVLLLFLTLGVFQGRRAMASTRPVVPWIGCFSALAVGTLIKGPQIVPFAAIALLASLADLERPAPRRRHLIGMSLGLLTFVAIVFAWLVPACVAGGRDYTEVLLGQLRGRVTGELQSHIRPWHYYFAQLPVAVFPWVLLFAASLPWTCRRLRANLWLLCWLVGGFVLLSVFASKRERYLSMILPACAIVLARYLTTVDLDLVGRIAMRATAAVLGAAGVAMIASGGIAFALGRMPAERLPHGTGEILVEFSPYALWVIAPLLGLIVITGAWVAWRRTRVDSSSAAVGGVLLSVAAMSLAFDLVIAPALDPVKAGRRIIAKTVEWSNRGVEIGALADNFDGRINMAIGRERLQIYEDEAAVEQALAAERPVGILVGHRRRRETDPLPTFQGGTLLAAGPLGGVRILLIGNRAAAALAPEAIE